MVRDIKKKILVADGCSWTAGDIVDPVLFPNQPWHVNHPDNLQYRLPRVWPHKLGKLLDLKTENIAHAGSSNDGIVRRTISKVEKLLENNKNEDIIVVIGWTSPERKDFFFKSVEDKEQAWDTLYPAQIDHASIKHKGKKDFYKLYTQYYWNEEEYVLRYIQSLVLLHNYLENNNITHYFFDAFYEATEAVVDPDKHAVFDSVSLNKFIRSQHEAWKNRGKYLNFIQSEGLFSQYFKIYDKVFIKDTMIEIMKGHLNKKELKDHDNGQLVFDETYHPTEFSHSAYAEHLFNTLTGVNRAWDERLI